MENSESVKVPLKMMHGQHGDRNTVDKGSKERGGGETSITAGHIMEAAGL